MPTDYKGMTIPEYSDPADVPATFRAFADDVLPLGGATMSGAISMGTYKITNLGTPGAAGDAATKNYVDTVYSNIVWGDIAGIPDTFPPSAHSHTAPQLPDASVDGQGVVRLTNSTSSASEILAPTAKALADTWDKAAHNHPYIPLDVPLQTADNPLGQFRVRNIIIQPSSPSGSNRRDGDLWFKPS